MDFKIQQHQNDKSTFHEFSLTILPFPHMKSVQMPPPEQKTLNTSFKCNKFNPIYLLTVKWPFSTNITPHIKNPSINVCQIYNITPLSMAFSSFNKSFIYQLKSFSSKNNVNINNIKEKIDDLKANLINSSVSNRNFPSQMKIYIVYHLLTVRAVRVQLNSKKKHHYKTWNRAKLR